VQCNVRECAGDPLRGLRGLASSELSAGGLRMDAGFGLGLFGAGGEEVVRRKESTLAGVNADGGVRAGYRQWWGICKEKGGRQSSPGGKRGGREVR